MGNALLSLKRRCSSVLRLWHICTACTVVAAIALTVHLTLPRNVGHQSRLTTSALLSYVGLGSLQSAQQQDLTFRVFPVNRSEMYGILGSMFSNCKADEEQLLNSTLGQRQFYRVQPIQELPQVLPSGGCMLHGLLLHCPVAQQQHLRRRSWHMLGESAWDRQAQPVSQDMAGSFLQKPGSLFRPQVLRALKQGFGTDILVSPDMYKQAAHNWGDPTRLHRFFRKLLRGELVKVVAVGGSVTTGMGARLWNESYVQRIHSWLQSLGTQDHPVHIEFTNSAVSATTSSYTSQCVNDFVPADADLILVEFSVNDWETVDPATFTWMDNSLRRGFERLLRKLLRLKSTPAVLVLHWWAPLHFLSSYWNVAEDELDVIASYYRLQSVSFRDAFYTPIMADRPGFRLEDLFCDIVHPNAVGHRLFAELVVLRLQEVLAGMLLAPADSEAWLQALPPPLFRGNEASGQAICLKGDALLSAVASAKVE
ncbi:hypothetical protein COCOBI_12-1470 [Coccomyxa sp. Obi]|nr:hypothetical protein COCOBI_12-1470 [Coccomyxa sp. Obi]